MRYFRTLEDEYLTTADLQYEYDAFMDDLEDEAPERQEYDTLEKWIDGWWLSYDTNEISEDEYLANHAA